MKSLLLLIFLLTSSSVFALPGEKEKCDDWKNKIGNSYLERCRKEAGDFSRSSKNFEQFLQTFNNIQCNTNCDSMSNAEDYCRCFKNINKTPSILKSLTFDNEDKYHHFRLKLYKNYRYQQHRNLQRRISLLRQSETTMKNLLYRSNYRGTYKNEKKVEEVYRNRFPGCSYDQIAEQINSNELVTEQCAVSYFQDRTQQFGKEQSGIVFNDHIENTNWTDADTFLSMGAGMEVIHPKTYKLADEYVTGKGMSVADHINDKLKLYTSRGIGSEVRILNSLKKQVDSLSPSYRDQPFDKYQGEYFDKGKEALALMAKISTEHRDYKLKEELQKELLEKMKMFPVDPISEALGINLQNVSDPRTQDFIKSFGKISDVYGYGYADMTIDTSEDAPILAYLAISQDVIEKNCHDIKNSIKNLCTAYGASNEAMDAILNNDQVDASGTPSCFHDALKGLSPEEKLQGEALYCDQIAYKTIHSTTKGKDSSGKYLITPSTANALTTLKRSDSSKIKCSPEFNLKIPTGSSAAGENDIAHVVTKRALYRALGKEVGATLSAMATVADKPIAEESSKLPIKKQVLPDVAPAEIASNSNNQFSNYTPSAFSSLPSSEPSSGITTAKDNSEIPSTQSSIKSHSSPKDQSTTSEFDKILADLKREIDDTKNELEMEKKKNRDIENKERIAALEKRVSDKEAELAAVAKEKEKIVAENIQNNVESQPENRERFAPTPAPASIAGTTTSQSFEPLSSGSSGASTGSSRSLSSSQASRRSVEDGVANVISGSAEKMKKEKENINLFILSTTKEGDIVVPAKYFTKEGVDYGSQVYVKEGEVYKLYKKNANRLAYEEDSEGKISEDKMLKLMISKSESKKVETETSDRARVENLKKELNQ